MKFGLTGPNYCTVSACASSNHAIGEGMRLIRDGYLDLCVVGGSEAATIPLTVAAFAQMTALTQEPRSGDRLAARSTRSAMASSSARAGVR